jgi:hypothetical protein
VKAGQRAVWTLLVIGLASAEVAADESPLTALLTCERRPGKGRVVCQLDVEAERGRVAWADAVILQVADHLRPLRSRVGFGEGTALTEGRYRLPVGLIATAQGDGKVIVRARALICEGRGQEETCVPYRRRVEAMVHVGPIRAR